MPQLRLPVPPPGAYWVVLRPGKHRVHATGTRFLVVGEPHPGWLLCWQDGQPPAHPKNLGEYLHESMVERSK